MAQKIHKATSSNPNNYGDVTGTSNLGYTFDFPSLSQDDIRVSVAGQLKTLTTDYTVEQWSATGSTSNYIKFNTSTTRGSDGTTVRIFRETPKTAPKASFTSGSAIKADDLNNNQKQSIYVAEEFEDDMTNLAANDATGFQINGSNIADNSITTTKIAGLNVQESDIANGAVTSNKLKSASNDADNLSRAVDTNHIRNGAVTDAKIAGVAGSKVTPDFGSQNIVTTGTLNSGNITVNTINATTADFSGELNLSGGGDSNRFLDVEIGNANTTSNSFYIRNFTGNNNPNNLAEFKKDGGDSKLIVGKINATQQFIGNGSGLTNLPSSALEGALPSIDGSALLGITSSIKRVKEASNANEVNFGDNADWHVHLTLNFQDVASTSRFLVFAVYQIKNENGHSNSITYAKIHNTGGSFIHAHENQNSSSGYQQFNHWEFDTAANTTNRTYTLQIRSNNSHATTNALVQKAFLIGIEFTPS